MNWITKIMDAFAGASPDRGADARGPHTEAGAIVGAGADNEVQMVIAGEPHLFVDEGDAIVHFVTRFEVEVQTTPFGPKLLPSIQPYWHPCKRHADATLSEIVERELRGPSPTPVPKAANRAVEPVTDDAPDMPVDVPQSGPSTAVRTASGTRKGGSYVGTILTWGEEVFPDRKRAGETYRSFAVRLQTAEREETLQGEGLKDAIAEAKAEVGNHVEIRRLHKVKVPAFRRSGEPKLDAHGQQIQHDKWLWAIKHSN
jgi:hypothetical protein